MPTFQITGPDGATYEIEGADERGALSALQKHLGQGPAPHAAPEPVQSAPGGGVLGDILPSLGTGLRGGMETLAGLPGDISNWTGQGAEWLASTFGADPDTASGVGQFARMATIPAVAAAPTSQRVREGLTQPILGDMGTHQPQTTAGEFARTIGEFAPAALAGPGGVGRRLLTQSLLPAITSETAGQVTEGTALETPARIGGALAGGILGARLGRTPVPGTGPTRTAAEIKAGAGYEGLKEPMKAVRVTRDGYRNLVATLKAEADDFGLVPEQHSAFERILGRHAKKAAKDGESLQDLEVLRRSLRNAGSTTDQSARTLSGRLIDKLDDAVDALDGTGLQVAEGQSADDVIAGLKQARAQYRVGKKAEIIEQAIAKAQNQASGVENGLRIQFRKIADNPKIMNGFTQVEQEAIKQVANGDFTRNAMRWLGTFGVPVDQGRGALGSILGGGVGATIGGAVGMPGLGALAVPALGTAARAGASRMAGNQARIVERLVKEGPGAVRMFNPGGNPLFPAGVAAANSRKRKEAR